MRIYAIINEDYQEFFQENYSGGGWVVPAYNLIDELVAYICNWNGVSESLVNNMRNDGADAFYLSGAPDGETTYAVDELLDLFNLRVRI